MCCHIDDFVGVCQLHIEQKDSVERVNQIPYNNKLTEWIIEKSGVMPS